MAVSHQLCCAPSWGQLPSANASVALHVSLCPQVSILQDRRQLTPPFQVTRPTYSKDRGRAMEASGSTELSLDSGISGHLCGRPGKGQGQLRIPSPNLHLSSNYHASISSLSLDYQSSGGWGQTSPRKEECTGGAVLTLREREKEPGPACSHVQVGDL